MIKKIIKILVSVIVGILVVGGIAFFVFIYYEIKAPINFIGTSSVLQKLMFAYEEAYKNKPYIRTVRSLRDVELAPFTSKNPYGFDQTPLPIEITSGATWSVEKSVSELSLADLILNPGDIYHRLWPTDFRALNARQFWNDFTNKIIELKFTNAKFSLHSMEVYNPAFSSLFSPYQAIDARLLGFWNTVIEAMYRGDFCIALYATSVLHHSWRDVLPDCHLWVLPRGIDTSYPYTRLRVGMLPLDTGNVATMEVVYHAFDAE